MTNPAATIQRFCDAAASNGFAVDRSFAEHFSTASATLLTDAISVRCSLMHTSDSHQIKLNDIHALNGTQRGHGRPALMKVFDIADQTGIEEITVVAARTGIYFHAAHFAQCRPLSLQFVQDNLLKNLAGYVRQSSGQSEKTARLAQANEATSLIRASTGQLGTLVQQLRAMPVIGATDEGYETLAKQLFLSAAGHKGYSAHWMRRERDMARRFYDWSTPPLAEPLPSPVKPLSPSNLATARLT